MTATKNLIEAVERLCAEAEAMDSRAPVSELEDMEARLFDKQKAVRALLPAAKEELARAKKRDWYPDADPITGNPFFMEIEHPNNGLVPTYGGPFDSYTLAVRDEDGGFDRERYDHDAGGWVDGCEAVPVQVVDEEIMLELEELRAMKAALRGEKGTDDERHD